MWMRRKIVFETRERSSWWIKDFVSLPRQERGILRQLPERNGEYEYQIMSARESHGRLFAKAS
jgi:hypothetical protein